MEQNTANTALVILDMQDGILAMLQDTQTLISNTAKAITNARSKNIKVIFVTVGFRNGAPEINMSNKSFSAGKERFSKMDMNAFTKVHSDLAPKEDEVTVMKRRVSAFSGSDFEVILRSFGIQHLILTGIATSGAVLSTLREASDKDYGLSVLSDCCADHDEEVQRVLTTKIFPRQSDVLTVQEWCEK